MSLGKPSIYKERAQLILLVFEQLNFFKIKDEFIAIIIQSPLQNEDTFNFDDFTTFSERVKKSTQETANKMENRLNDKIDSRNINIEDKISNFEIKITNKIFNAESEITRKITNTDGKITNIEDKIYNVE